MRRLNLVFDDEDFERMAEAKEESGMTWHDFLIDAVAVWVEAGDDEE